MYHVVIDEENVVKAIHEDMGAGLSNCMVCTTIKMALNSAHSIVLATGESLCCLYVVLQDIDS